MTTATAQQSQVTQHSHELCMALLTDFIEHSIRSHKRSLANATEQYSTDYHQSRIDELQAGNADYDFYLDKGRKYYKLIMKDSSGSQSVHAFIDRNTGDVYKPAGWKGPAKYVRYNLLNEESRERCFEVADWGGRLSLHELTNAHFLYKILSYQLTFTNMDAPDFYIVADGNAYAMEEDGYMYGAPVKMDGTPDWDAFYDFDFERGMDDDEAEYVIHMCNLLQQTVDLSKEFNKEVFVK